MEARLTVWAKRWSVARGWQWVAQREVTAETAEQWLAVFRTDEPAIRFEVSARKPRT